MGKKGKSGSKNKPDKDHHGHQPVKVSGFIGKHDNRGGRPKMKSKSEAKSGLSALQMKFAKKLEGSRFRIINEKLYTTRGQEALEQFQENPSLFDVYHEGFREQASHWPENPLDGIIRWIKSKHSKAVVADMGCGDARLGKSISNKVHSFDLVSKSSDVIACDIANVPLPDASVDVAIFCLALMGTNIADFLREARRVLKSGGVLRIAEVRSRFEGEKDGIKKFVQVIKRCGFDLVQGQSNSEGGSKADGKGNNSNKMFFEVEARKSSREPQADLEYTAKACIYKRR